MNTQRILSSLALTLCLCIGQGHTKNDLLKQVDDLVRLSINPKSAVYVEVQSENREATAENLEQGYVTCPSDKRFLLLFTFLKKNKNL